MATINYKDTKQFLSFVIKREFFRGWECKKMGQQPNLVLEGVRCGLDMKIARMGHKRISHSGY